MRIADRGSVFAKCTGTQAPPPGQGWQYSTKLGAVTPLQEEDCKERRRFPALAQNVREAAEGHETHDAQAEAETGA